MLIKSVLAALILAATAISLPTTASAGPGAQESPAGTPYYMFRGSQNHDNGGN